MKIGRCLAVVLVGVAACLLAGCGRSAPAGSGGAVRYASGGTFVEPIYTAPGNLNPLQANQGQSLELDSFAYDTLAYVTNSGTVVPGLATRWRVTARSVTFTLRSGVTCADGAALTASDVASNFAYIKNPKNNASAIGSMLPSTHFSVSASNRARTVTVSMASAYGFLLEGAGSVPIVCPRGLADPGLLAHHTDGTGPFTLTSYVPGDHYTFAVRKGYRWGPGGATTDVPGFPAKVVFQVVTGDSTVANLLLSGQVNDGTLQGPDRVRLEGHGFGVHQVLSGPVEMFFNQRAGLPGASLAVRRALTTALDLDALTKVLTQGTGSRAQSLTVVPPVVCPGDTVAGTLPARNLAAAGTLLDAAGWRRGPGGTRTRDGRRLRVALVYPTLDVSVSAAMELVRQWWQQLGVEVRLEPQGSTAVLNTLFRGGRWDATLIAVGLSDPNEFMAYATGPAAPHGQNFAAIANTQYLRLATRALATPGKAGCALWAQADQTLFRNLNVVPIATTTQFTFVSRARYANGPYGPEPTSIRLLATSR